MKFTFLLGFIPGLWAFGIAQNNIDANLSLMIIYFTWLLISLLYLINSLFRAERVSRAGGSCLRYKMNAWFLVGAIFGAGLNSVIKVSSAVLILMYMSI